MTFNRIQEKPKSSGIRRVMKQGLYCICGMCGKRYGSETQAEACLKTCIELYMTQESVTEGKPKNSGSSYRCSYCKRTYEKINQAKECASVCKISIKNKISSESKAKSGQSRAEKLQILANFSGGGQTTPDSSNNSATLRARAVQDRIEISPYNEIDSIQDLDEEDLESEKIPEEKTLNPQKPKKNSEGIEKFYRDGAKYACNKCRKKFFSRDEVISCFDNHGPEEDQLVSGRTAPSEPQPETNESPKNSNLDALRLQRAAIK
ncbi:MAG: hypothetical protein NTX25_02850, partial [Proteobacteria bacterium]|nr:hypothetical protein [Pseudomonadota bacterium]